LIPSVSGNGSREAFDSPPDPQDPFQRADRLLLDPTAPSPTAGNLPGPWVFPSLFTRRVFGFRSFFFFRLATFGPCFKVYVVKEDFSLLVLEFIFHFEFLQAPQFQGTLLTREDSPLNLPGRSSPYLFLHQNRETKRSCPV